MIKKPQNSPYVVAVLGPNGSGKTSLLDEIRITGLKGLGGVFPIPSLILNPDQIAKELTGNFATPHEKDLAAFHKAVQMRRAVLESGETFAFESVASHTSRIGELISLKEAGYCVLLVFITTDDPETNVARVNFRYESGATTGHWVDPDKVRSRYHRTLKLLPKAAEIVDAAFIYDNSAESSKPTQQAVIDGADFSVIKKPAAWVYKSLVDRVQQRIEQMIAIQDDFDAAGLIEAVPTGGHYQGPIHAVSTDYLVMLDEEQDRFVIHDRIMLDTDLTEDEERFYEVGDYVIITYEMNSAPTVDFKI